MTTACEAVTGKLLAAKGLLVPPSDGATILVWYGDCELSAELLSGAVGLVFPDCIDESQSRSVSHLAELCRIPTLRVGDPVSFARSAPLCEVAILVPTQGKLFVNPDVETVRAYLCTHPRSIKKRISVLSTARSIEGADGVFAEISPSLFETEDSAYDYFCELADENTGAKIAVSIPFESNSERFSATVAALYRAGVWGRFSLVCSSIDTPARAKECAAVLRSVFCRLDATDREFNGFIPKGICIDTPLLLLQAPTRRAPDFLCIDVDTLCKSFSGGRLTTPDVIAPYLSGLAKALPHTLLALKLDSIPHYEFIRQISPTEIYAPAEVAAEILTWI